MDRYWTALVELRDSVFGGRSGLLKFPESTVRDLHLADYDMILAAIDRLSQDFHNRMSQRVAWMSVSESKHSIKEAEAVRHLTQLAFFFIPLTFVTSCFGMNLDLLSSGSGKLWAFFATASCTTAAVLLLSSCYPLLLDRMKKIGRAFVNWALALRVIFKLANYLPRDAAWMLLLSLRHPLIIHRFLTNIDLPKRLLTYDTGTMAYRTTSELSAFWNHKGESIFHYFAGITRR
ncbi:hypothetical protein QBC44DRAFT_318406 [Cladorrhinum sp. PSN332]|nr:hypothetical protein QBC44DRAFT_318406 [Cladorrhinum sp. PSN332]